VSIATKAAAAARRLRAKRRWECPRCRLAVANTVAKCPRCGWIDPSTTANLEAHGGLLAHQGDGSSGGGAPGPF
jgi:hypothetical protein